MKIDGSKCYVLLFLTGLLCIGSCSQTGPSQQSLESMEQQKVNPEFQRLIHSAGLVGSILLYDPQQLIYHSNDFDWAKRGQLPASTFKIANSIIGLETGVLEDDSTLFKWDGKERSLKVWEQDLILRDAFHYSCVPCYQEVARNIGVQRMNAYLRKLQYGDVKVDSTNIDRFWLEGESRISPMQQIDFLEHFFTSNLNISERTEKIMKRMMVVEATNTYILSAKTGWSITNGKDNGWFVGFLERGDSIYYFATNVEPTPDFDRRNFAMIRKQVTFEAMQLMGLRDH